MKKVKNRANSALLLALLLIACLCLYIFRFLKDGQIWASFKANQSVYAVGILDTGTLTDRNGVILAAAGDGIYRYAEDPSVRAACFHAVGDYAGNIGTGALSKFAAKLSGYSLVEGVYSQDGKGGTVKLTIDSELCKTAYAALGGRKGAVMVMNYKTGEILCMTSSPSYDSNNIPDLTFDKYDGVYINRCINGLYAPGSVFKIITLAAAIENIYDLSIRQFYCEGSFVVGDSHIKCSGVHGTQTIEQAFANSCNCAFGQLSLELGGETLQKHAKSLGITVSHDISGIDTAAGNFIAEDDDTADLAWSGIGQADDMISPFSLLRVVSAIANGGDLKTPILLSGERSGGKNLMSAATADKLADMMSYNVTWRYGTYNFPGLSLCAKTGTAELDDGTSHAWFAGFLDDTSNPLAFVVIAERSGSGFSVAAPIANTVLQAAVAKSS